jgi:cytidylate kinase
VAEKKKRVKKIIIAIDGYSSCGKSTLAKDLAKKLNYEHVDSGAMYRAVTLYCILHNVDVNDEAAVVKILPKVKIAFKHNTDINLCETYLNGKNVEASIRTMEVANLVSVVSRYKKVREAMVAQQQELGKGKGIVMDGRDIGTVVFPEAELKIFVTANFEIRVDRRLHELKAKGINITHEEVAKNLSERDHIDVTRAESPLRKADDARELDNTFLSPAGQLQAALFMANEIIRR